MKTRADHPRRLTKFNVFLQRIFHAVQFFTYLPSQRGYNLTISHEYKFVWFRVAKVGSRTIYNHLKDEGITLDVEHPYNIYYPPKRYQNYFKFAFVRNPWERFVSCWHDKVIDKNYFKFDDVKHEQMKDLNNFVEYVAGLNLETCDIHLRLQCCLIDLNHLDYLRRLETFDEDLKNIYSRLNIPYTVSEQKNKSSRNKSYQEYLEGPLKRKVTELYQRDIQIFGYTY